MTIPDGNDIVNVPANARQQTQLQFVVCGLWFVVCGMWFAICGWRLVVYVLWLVVFISHYLTRHDDRGRQEPLVRNFAGVAAKRLVRRRDAGFCRSKSSSSSSSRRRRRFARRDLSAVVRKRMAV